MPFPDKHDNGRRYSGIEKLSAIRAFFSPLSGLLQGFCPASAAKLARPVPFHDLNGFINKRKTLFTHLCICLPEIHKFHSFRRLRVIWKLHGIAVCSIKGSEILFPDT